MEVTWHADARVVVFSLWQSDTCRSTFQMPVEDAPALVASLSSALGEALTPADDGQRRGPTRAGTCARVLAAVRRMVRRGQADVVPLRARPGSARRAEG